MLTTAGGGCLSSAGRAVEVRWPHPATVTVDTADSLFPDWTFPRVSWDGAQQRLGRALSSTALIDDDVAQ